MFRKIVKYDEVSLGEPLELKTEENKEENKISQDDQSNIDIDENDANVLLKRAQDQANKIINAAKEEAKNIVNTAKSEANIEKNQIIEEARKIGYDDGFTRGYSENEQLIQESEEIRKKAKEEYDETIENMEQEIINIVLKITFKIMGYEIANNNEYIIQLIKNMIRKTSVKENLKIKVSNEDFLFVSENITEFYKVIDGLSNLEVKKDESLQKGDCVIDTPYGSIDGSVDKQIEKVQEVFHDLIKG